MIKRHAYLIIAHNNFFILEIILKILDDERNDIYIHIDKKVKNFNKNKFEKLLKFSNIEFIKRKNIFWADFSQVEVILDLLNSAYSSKKNYSYYHLLSGSDLPIKTQDEIHNFFDKKHNEFVGIVPESCEYHINHVSYYYPLINTNYYRKYKLVKLFVFSIVKIEKFLGINRIRNSKIKFIDGWSWFSITNEFCKFIIKNKKWIERKFKYTMAPDEMFLHTIAFNSHFRKRLYNEKDLSLGSMRYIDWKRGKPYIFRLSNFDELSSSPYLFARKFDEKADFAIVQKVYNYLTSKPLIRSL